MWHLLIQKVQQRSTLNCITNKKAVQPTSNVVLVSRTHVNALSTSGTNGVAASMSNNSFVPTQKDPASWKVRNATCFTIGLDPLVNKDIICEECMFFYEEKLNFNLKKHDKVKQTARAALSEQSLAVHGYVMQISFWQGTQTKQHLHGPRQTRITQSNFGSRVTKRLRG